jgi:ribonuclease T1
VTRDVSSAWRKALWLVLALCLGLAASACAREPAALPEVRLAQLPPEAAQTLALIKRGGPFPYRRDGTVFGNRERLLPLEKRGYYREYTVPTPGAKDRGARRIVAGSRSEYYYTDDHYASFRRIRD